MKRIERSRERKPKTRMKGLKPQRTAQICKLRSAVTYLSQKELCEAKSVCLVHGAIDISLQDSMAR